MAKVIQVDEMEKTVNEYTNIEEPIIVKRKNNNDLDKKIQEGEEDIKNGKTHKLRNVLKELRGEYEY